MFKNKRTDKYMCCPLFLNFLNAKWKAKRFKFSRKSVSKTSIQKVAVLDPTLDPKFTENGAKMATSRGFESSEIGVKKSIEKTNRKNIAFSELNLRSPGPGGPP